MGILGFPWSALFSPLMTWLDVAFLPLAHSGIVVRASLVATFAGVVVLSPFE